MKRLSKVFFFYVVLQFFLEHFHHLSDAEFVLVVPQGYRRMRPWMIVTIVMEKKIHVLDVIMFYTLGKFGTDVGCVSSLIVFCLIVSILLKKCCSSSFTGHWWMTFVVLFIYTDIDYLKISVSKLFFYDSWLDSFST